MYFPSHNNWRTGSVILLKPETFWKLKVIAFSFITMNKNFVFVQGFGFIQLRLLGRNAG
jgi:hypothetical protein